MVNRNSKTFRFTWLDCIVLPLLLFVGYGCSENAFLRGTVYDISGEQLPGVVVRVVGTDYEGLSNALGNYYFRAASGNLVLEFCKTGYAPVRKPISVTSLGFTNVEDVKLWPLPASEGVFAFINFKYHQADHPRVNRYLIKNGGVGYGTPVEATLRIPFTPPEEDPAKNPPSLIAYKMPKYDAHLHKLKKVEAAPFPISSSGKAERPPKEVQYNLKVWVADEPIPLSSRFIDETEQFLMELVPSVPLEAGVYAVHWRALEGYDSIDPRIFLFDYYSEEPLEKLEGELAEKEKETVTSESKHQPKKKT